MRRFGVRNTTWLTAALLAAVACGVRYGFAGGGLPAHIRTMAVIPFENETASPEVQRELFELLRRELRGRLGVREAPEATADALVRGTIKNYDVDIPVGFSADPQQAVTARRKLQVTIDIAIVDQSTGRPLWERRGLRAEGEYAEREEADGRRSALRKIVSDIVEGAQSQW
jgi:Lipopolysaccharide-assembly